MVKAFSGRKGDFASDRLATFLAVGRKKGEKCEVGESARKARESGRNMRPLATRCANYLSRRV